MPDWSQLLNEFNSYGTPEEKSSWLNERLNGELQKIAERRSTNVIVYASGFLQKPQVPSFYTSIGREDINGFMCSVNGLDFSRGLSLILHTPGGDMPSTETIVQYLRSKFDYIETIVPVYAQSGGTMIAFGSEKIVMGRQSQLGPIDAQLHVPSASGFVPASSVLGQFNQAKMEIEQDRGTALVWAPILQSMGPSLLQQAQEALSLGQQMAEFGLENHMFKDSEDAKEKAKQVAEYFNSRQVHLDHGRRIGVEECIFTGLNVERLEANQEFQDEVLTAYHLLTILFEQSIAVKTVRNHSGKAWVKNFSQ